MKKIFPLILFLFIGSNLLAEDGYQLWLRYKKVDNLALLTSYKTQLNSIFIQEELPTVSVIKNELTLGLNGMLVKTC